MSGKNPSGIQTVGGSGAAGVGGTAFGGGIAGRAFGAAGGRGVVVDAGTGTGGAAGGTGVAGAGARNGPIGGVAATAGTGGGAAKYHSTSLRCSRCAISIRSDRAGFTQRLAGYSRSSRRMVSMAPDASCVWFKLC